MLVENKGFILYISLAIVYHEARFAIVRTAPNSESVPTWKCDVARLQVGHSVRTAELLAGERRDAGNTALRPRSLLLARLVASSRRCQYVRRLSHQFLDLPQNVQLRVIHWLLLCIRQHFTRATRLLHVTQPSFSLDRASGPTRMSSYKRYTKEDVTSNTQPSRLAGWLMDCGRSRTYQVRYDVSLQT